MVTTETVKAWVQSLANSQGYYGRLYRKIDEDNLWDEFVDELNNAHVKTAFDMVMLLEG